MGHEIESRHQQNEVNKSEPMLLESGLNLFQEPLCDILVTHRLSLGLHRQEGIRFREIKSPDNQQNRRTSSEPKQCSPPMGIIRGDRKIEHGGKKVSERVALLKQTGEKSSRGDRSVFECRSRCVSVHSTH